MSILSIRDFFNLVIDELYARQCVWHTDHTLEISMDVSLPRLLCTSPLVRTAILTYFKTRGQALPLGGSVIADQFLSNDIGISWVFDMAYTEVKNVHRQDTLHHAHCAHRRLADSAAFPRSDIFDGGGYGIVNAILLCDLKQMTKGDDKTMGPNLFANLVACTFNFIHPGKICAVNNGSLVLSPNNIQIARIFYQANPQPSKSYYSFRFANDKLTGPTRTQIHCLQESVALVARIINTISLDL